MAAFILIWLEKNMHDIEQYEGGALEGSRCYCVTWILYIILRLDALVSQENAAIFSFCLKWE